MRYSVGSRFFDPDSKPDRPPTQRFAFGLARDDLPEFDPAPDVYRFGTNSRRDGVYEFGSTDSDVHMRENARRGKPKKRVSRVRGPENEKPSAGAPPFARDGKSRRPRNIPAAPTSFVEQKESGHEARVRGAARALDGGEPERAIEACRIVLESPGIGLDPLLRSKASLVLGKAQMCIGEVTGAAKAASASEKAIDAYYAASDDPVEKQIRLEVASLRSRIQTYSIAKDRALAALCKPDWSSVRLVTDSATVSPYGPLLCAASCASTENVVEMNKSLTVVVNLLKRAKRRRPKSSSAAPDADAESLSRTSVQFARVLHRGEKDLHAKVFLEAVLSFLNVWERENGASTNRASAFAAVELAYFSEMDVLKRSGNAFYADGKYKEAIQAYTKGLTLDLGHDAFNALLLCNRAAARLRRGETILALEDCERALRLRPSMYKARYRRAKALRELGRLREAVHDFEVAYRANPTAEILTAFRRAKAELASSRDDVFGRSSVPDRDQRRHSSSWSFPRPQASSSSPPRYGTAFSAGAARSSSGARPTCVPPVVVDPSCHYAVLCVPMTASSVEIKKAYRALALKHHPDKTKTKSDSLFQRINESFSVLKDAASRKAYDVKKYQYSSVQS